MSVQKTENLQQQLSVLQLQKSEAVCRVKKEAEKQLHIVRRSEETHCSLKAKVGCVDGSHEVMGFY